MFSWLSVAALHAQGTRGIAAACSCFLCVLVLFVCHWQTHSLVLLASAWLSLLAFSSLISSLYSMSLSYRPTASFSYGLARVPVLAVFSTTVLAQLFSIFLSKESLEHLLSPDHHGGSHDAQHETAHGPALAWAYPTAVVAVSVALLLSAYALKNQPFQHVLSASVSSSVQEHAADLSNALCWFIPGLSRLLLPRINAMVLLAAISSGLILLAEYFRQELPWSDPVCCLLLCVVVFSSMWPLSLYTGRILLQTAPGHLLNQLDRCLSECSTIDGVLELRSAHFWQLDFASMVATVDVRVRRDADEQVVLTVVTERLSSLVNTLTVQVMKDAAWRPAEMSEAVAESVNKSLPSSQYVNYEAGGRVLPAYQENISHGHSHEGEGHGHSHN